MKYTTAWELAAGVRSGDIDPVALVDKAIAKATATNPVLGAFRAIRVEAARAEAAALRDRTDLADLPLAGVPVAVKDVAEIAGEYPEWGSRATPRGAAVADHDVVRRLRAAGAIVIGVTRVPEFCVWPTSDGPDGIVRNPWEPAYTAGGSSGGSGCAVAAPIPLEAPVTMAV
jgi:amidase